MAKKIIPGTKLTYETRLALKGVTGRDIRQVPATPSLAKARQPAKRKK